MKNIFLIQTSLIAILIGFVVWFLILIFQFTIDQRRIWQEERDNPCIIGQPIKAVSGKIVYRGAFLNAGPAKYYVNYIGKRALTGDECLQRINVTESEYERRMY